MHIEYSLGLSTSIALLRSVIVASDKAAVISEDSKTLLEAFFPRDTKNAAMVPIL
jgi:hypothetical protein